MYPESIPVYAPGVFRRGAAKAFALKAEEQVDADLTIDAAGLHTLRGRVYDGTDRHLPSGLILQLQEAGSTDIARFVEGEEEARFRFMTCPPGSMC